MIRFFVYTIVAMIVVELFHRLRILSFGYDLQETLRRTMAIILLQKASDHWKQRALLAYARKLAKLTAKLGGVFIVVSISVYATTIGFDLLLIGNAPHIDALLTPRGMIATTIIAAVYVCLRSALKKSLLRNGYGLGARLLHYLALGVPGVAEASFNVDSALNRSLSDVLNRRHVFIAGLARSGTTVLLQTFHNTGNFRSLTYRDMPFVLMPNTWKGLSFPFKQKKLVEERAHGDGVMVDFDSPEALEEVFWRTFCGKDYILDQYLKPHEVNNEIVAKFRRYISLIILSASDERNQVYLSKNNNNILRLSSIAKAFPNALILIPFRDPIQQAISLKRQHDKFSERQCHDKFSLRYMAWLAHHEFGLSHKKFVVNETMAKDTDPRLTEDIHYWLNLWIHVYSYILTKRTNNMLFVSYTALCHNSLVVVSELFRAANIKVKLGKDDMKFSESIWAVPERLDQKVVERARAVYTQLHESNVGVCGKRRGLVSLG